MLGFVRDIMIAADSGKPQRALPQEEPQRPGPVQSFLDSLLGSVFGGGNRGATSNSSSPRDTRPPARKPDVVYEYPTDRSRGGRGD